MRLLNKTYHLEIDSDLIGTAYFLSHDELTTLEITFHYTMDGLVRPYNRFRIKLQVDEISEEQSLAFIEEGLKGFFTNNTALPVIDKHLKRENFKFRLDEYENDIILNKEYYGFGKGTYIYIDSENQYKYDSITVPIQDILEDTKNRVNKL